MIGPRAPPGGANRRSVERFSRLRSGQSRLCAVRRFIRTLAGVETHYFDGIDMSYFIPASFDHWPMFGDVAKLPARTVHAWPAPMKSYQAGIAIAAY